MPKEYRHIVDDAWDDFDLAKTESMTEEEVTLALQRTGVGEERIHANPRHEMERAAASMGQTLIERLCWMTRAEREAWLETTRWSDEEKDEVRGIWSQTLEELASTGKLSAKLRAELEADGPREKKAMTATERAVLLQRRNMERLAPTVFAMSELPNG